MGKIIEWLEEISANNPVNIAVLVFGLMLVVVVALSIWFYDTEFYENILVEAHGMLFDLLVIGFFIGLIVWVNFGEKLGGTKKKLRITLDGTNQKQNSG